MVARRRLPNRSTRQRTPREFSGQADPGACVSAGIVFKATSADRIKRDDWPMAYSIPQLADATSLSRSLIYQHINAQLLKITKAGRRTIVLRDDALRWLEGLRKNELDI